MEKLKRLWQKYRRSRSKHAPQTNEPSSTQPVSPHLHRQSSTLSGQDATPPLSTYLPHDRPTQFDPVAPGEPNSTPPLSLRLPSASPALYTRPSTSLPDDLEITTDLASKTLTSAPESSNAAPGILSRPHPPPNRATFPIENPERRLEAARPLKRSTTSTEAEPETGIDSPYNTLLGPLRIRDDEEGLWTKAFAAYVRNGGNLKDVWDFLLCNNASEGKVLKDAAGKFDEFRESHEKCFNFMNGVMGGTKVVIEIIGGTATNAFAPASVLFGILNVFFKACYQVTEEYDTINIMFEELVNFLDRLLIYEKIPNLIRGTFRNNLVEILRILLEVIAFATAAVREKTFNRLKQFFKNLGQDQGSWQAKREDLDRYWKLELLHLSATQSEKLQELLDYLGSQKTDQYSSPEMLLTKLQPALKEKSIFAQEIIPSLVPGTGQWIQNVSQYKDWIGNKRSIMLISGPLGIGKTYLCGNIIKLLGPSSQGHQNTIVVSFCKEDSDEKLDLKKMLRTWAYDLALQDPLYCKHVSATFASDFDPLKAKYMEELWEKLFVNFLQSVQRRKHSHVFFVLDGLDVARAEKETVASFFKLMKSIHGMKQNVCQHQSDPTSQTSFYFRFLVSARLDGIETRDYSGLHHFQVRSNKEPWGDVKKYISSRFYGIKFLEENQKAEYVSILTRRAESFAYASSMMRWIELAKTKEEIADRMKNLPENTDDIIRATLDHFISETDDVCQVLNTALLWTMYSRVSHTLGSLDLVFKIEDRYKRGVPQLDEVIRSQPSLFAVTVREDPSSPAKEFEKGLVETDPASVELKYIISMKKREDRRKSAYLNQAYISISQNTLENYLRTTGQNSQKIGIEENQAHIRIALVCMKLFVDQSIYNTSRESNLAAHATQFAFFHISSAEPDRTHNQQMVELICQMFSDPNVLERWADGKALQLLMIDLRLGERGIYKGGMLKWLKSFEEEPLMGSHLQWVTEVNSSPNPYDAFLRPMVNCVAQRWLRSTSLTAAISEWSSLESFVTLVPRDISATLSRTHPTDSKRMALVSAADRTGLNTSTKLNPGLGEPVSTRIFRIARYFNVSYSEDSVWHFRIAQILRFYSLLDEAEGELRKLSGEDPHLHVAYCELSEVLRERTQKALALQDYETALQVFTEAVGLYRKALHGFEEMNDNTSRLLVAGRMSELAQWLKKEQADSRSYASKWVIHRIEAGDVKAAFGLIKWLDEKPDIIDELRTVWELSRTQEVDSTAHLAFTRSLLTHLSLEGPIEEICNYLHQLQEDVAVSGESRLFRYCRMEPFDPLALAFLPRDHTSRLTFRNRGILNILEHCLDEAQLTQNALESAFQDALATFYVQDAGYETKAIELWKRVLDNSGRLSQSSLHNRAQANATRHLSSIYFTRGLVERALGWKPDLAAEELKRTTEDGSDPRQRMWWLSHCSSLMLSIWRLGGDLSEKAEAHRDFKSNVLLAIDILEDADKTNDSTGFLLLAETLMSTGVDDKDASTAMRLFLHHSRHRKSQTPIKCDGCGKSCKFEEFQVCRYCKTDFCHTCHGSLERGELRFRLCHPLHQYFEPSQHVSEVSMDNDLDEQEREKLVQKWVNGLKIKWAA